MSKSRFETGDLVFWRGSKEWRIHDDMGIVISNGWPLRILWLASDIGVGEWLKCDSLYTQQEWKELKHGP